MNSKEVSDSDLSLYFPPLAARARFLLTFCSHSPETPFSLTLIPFSELISHLNSVFWTLDLWLSRQVKNNHLICCDMRNVLLLENQ
ncbi:hypothetical protein CBR_g33931 [Chara braunii]|uniref:Uncharacterized protein n=1 Tax=Chara braunii TaxID=69332 RepID=A0A388LHP6_CHABU|nr:hypothetical protein CBR_g33931 [Chara braunii]|eukprot:GBG81753.1 hypothetical protein CBR_g33931 [Chara braunii]